MARLLTFSLSLLALYSAGALAKTDYDGCTSYTSMVTVDPEPGYGNTYATVIWYDPDTLEICQYVDCGGGRAPPKSVPGCPLYDGPETVEASFLTADPLAPATQSAHATATATGTSTRKASTVASQTGSASAGTDSGALTTATGASSAGVTQMPTLSSSVKSAAGNATASGTSSLSTTDSPAGAAPTAAAAVVLNLAVGLAAAAAFI